MSEYFSAAGELRGGSFGLPARPGAVPADAAAAAAEPEHAQRSPAANRTDEPGTFAAHLSESGKMFDASFSSSLTDEEGSKGFEGTIEQNLPH